MAYVPQFIPTNTQVLQGTLNQYQQSADTETNRLNQVNDLYSALPTTNPYDTTEKNRIMGEFQKNAIADLDKKYNYDRSNQQYAKDLASKITELRSNPLWTLVKERDQLDTMRQKVMAEKGSDYYENFNPDTTTSLNDLKSWRPMDLKDMERQIATNAAEHAQSIRARSIDRPVAGVIEIVDQTGFPDIEKATNWLLNSKEGQGWLVQSVQGTGFEGHLDDPKVKSRAINAALSQLVGKPDRKIMADPMAREIPHDKIDVPRGMLQNSTGQRTDINYKYPIDNISKRKLIDQEIETTQDAIVNEQDPEKKNQLVGQLQEQQKGKDEVDDVINMAWNTDDGKKTIDAGKKLIKKYLPNISNAEVDSLNNTLIDLHREFSDASINPTEHPRALALKGLEVLSTMKSNNKTDTGEFLSSFFGTMGQGTSNQGNIANVMKNLGEEGVQRIVDTYNTIKDTQTASVTMFKLGAKIYTQEINNGRSKIAALRKAKSFINEFEDYHSGNGNFVNNNVSKVDYMANATLSAGKTPIFNEYSLPSDMLTTKEKGQIVGIITENMSSFTPINSELLKGGKNSSVWKEGMADKVASVFDNDNTKFHALFDNENNALITLNYPGDPSGKGVKPMKETFKVNVATASFDLLNELYKRTGERKFLTQIYDQFNLARNKEYSVDDKNGYLPLQLGRYFTKKDQSGKSVPDIDAFSGFRMKQVVDIDGGTHWEVTPPDEQTIIYPNKFVMFDALNAYKEQNDAWIKNNGK
jgi:hypothetical protein